LTSVWVFGLADLTPDGRNERVSYRSAVAKQTGSSFTDVHSGTAEVFMEALIMLEKPPQFEFAHRLLGGALHDGLRGSNKDRTMIGFD